MKAKSDAERRHEAAQAELAAAEKAGREAEKVIASCAGKILTKQRALRSLKNTISGAERDKNSAADRYAKEADIDGDISRLEAKKSDAESTLAELREKIRSFRAEASKAAAAFSVEADRKRLDYDAQRTEIAVRGQELKEQQLVQAEKTAAEAAKTKLEEARIAGASAERLARLEMEFKAASQRFEWEQRIAESERSIEARLVEIDRAAAGEASLAQLQGQIAEEKAATDHVRSLGIIDADTEADVTRIRTTAEEHRANVSHEVDEDIRKAFEMLAINAEQADFETMNAMKLMVLKHQLDKNFETHKSKLAREGRSDDLAELAADYKLASQWVDQQQNRNN